MNEPRIGAVVLAGGLARRMDGIDKGLVVLAGKPMVQHVIESIQDAVDALVINANRNQQRYGAWSHQVVGDRHVGHPGPLAGLAAGMTVLDTPLVFMCPCDSPFVTASLVARLAEGLGDADIAAPHDGERLQPVFALLRRCRLDSLLEFLDSGERKIDRWYESERFVAVEAVAERGAFANINTAEELQRAEGIISRSDSKPGT